MHFYLERGKLDIFVCYISLNALLIFFIQYILIIFSPSPKSFYIVPPQCTTQPISISFSKQNKTQKPGNPTTRTTKPKQKPKRNKIKSIRQNKKHIQKEYVLC